MAKTTSLTSARLPISLLRAIVLRLRPERRPLPRDILAWCLRVSGATILSRRVLHRDQPAILMYHDPSPEVFASHVAFLERTHNVVSLDQLVDALRSGRLDDLPPRAIAITIDDGWKGNHRLRGAFDRLSAKPTIFLTTGLLDTTRHFWFTVASRELGNLLHRSTEERLAVLAQQANWRPTDEYGEADVLTTEQALDLSTVAQLQPHGRLHHPVGRCSDTMAKDEIEGSIADVQTLTGEAPRHYAFAHGVFGPRDMAICEQAGLQSARGTRFGRVKPETNPYSLPIVGTSDDASVAWLAAQMTGVPNALARAVVSVNRWRAAHR